MNWYLQVFKKYAVFQGRARRKEYWMFFLINFLVSIVLGILAFVGLGLLAGIYNLAVLLPWLAVMVRRLHDTDRSGWWVLITLVPLVGPLILLVFMVLEGTRGDNRFGADPKAAA